jgi:diguanylate cyclase (GGDEF)-like protein/PAS domain S-box-containing protein
MLSLRHLFLTPPESSLLYGGFYDPVLVGLSVLVAVFAAYAAILVSHHVTALSAGSRRRVWVTVGGLCLGSGIWAMHFVSMLAFNLPCSTRYDAWLTLLSTVPGIVVSILAINILSQPTLSARQMLRGSLLIGAGVGSMHYTGMAAMQIDGLILYNLKLFVLSLVIAVALAYLALWIKTWLYKSSDYGKSWVSLASAFALGLAVSGMHYMAMLSVYFVHGDTNITEPGIEPAFLAMIVLIVSGMIILATMVSTYLELPSLFSLKRSYRLMGVLLLAWLGAAWFGSDNYYSRLSADFHAQEAQLAAQQIEHLASNIQRSLKVLQGIAVVAAKDPSIRRTLSQYGPHAVPSTLAYATRKQQWTQDTRLADISSSLTDLANNLTADVIWVMNSSGDCVAASNSGTADSLVGTNYVSRDYFRMAITGQQGQQYAMGSITGKPGLYYSAPLVEGGQIVGVVAVKRNLDYLTDWVNLHHAFLVDANGIIILAGEKEWQNHVMTNAAVMKMTSQSRMLQYKKDDFDVLSVRPWADTSHHHDAVLIGRNAIPRLLSSRPLAGHNLTVYVARPLEQLIRFQSDRNWLFFLLSASGSMLIIAASAIVIHLRDAQKATSESRVAATAFEARQAMMITDASRSIVRVNQAFTEVTGYNAAEVLGKVPHMLRSGQHDDTFYEEMWDTATHEGAWQGEIWNKRKSGQIYPEWLMITAVRDDSGEVTHYVSAMTDITERKQAENEINNLAFYDPLTNLPNRRLLMDRLGQAIASSARTARYCALLFIDLDNFKHLNDNRGHQVGDILLQQVARRLQSCVREGDTTARLGGDEFVVMLEDMNPNQMEAAEQAKVVAEKILATLNQPYQLGSYAHHSTPSIGVTLFAQHQCSIDDLLKRADLAMYEAKASGRNTLRFYDPLMQAVVSTRAALDDDLRKAIEQQQFVLFFQAQVNFQGVVTGAEALLRWPHPQRGMVSPAEFIPQAEESGLILTLGRWVTETACRQLANWAQHPELAHLSVSVNVSAHQFRQADFVQEMLTLIEDTGANPHRLKLELTESLLVKDVEDIIVKMTALKARGVGFSLDDFGTGYSSLSYLKRLPLDQLKIDQSFVRNILTDGNDAAIAKMVVALAQSLGLSVIAEGVELQAQRTFLSELGCDNYQGYLFGRPVPTDQFEQSVRQASPTVPRAV